MAIGCNTFVQLSAVTWNCIHCVEYEDTERSLVVVPLIAHLKNSERNVDGYRYGDFHKSGQVVTLTEAIRQVCYAYSWVHRQERWVKHNHVGHLSGRGRRVT